MSADRLIFDLRGVRPASREAAWKDFVRDRFLTLDLADVDFTPRSSIECWGDADVFVSRVRAGTQRVIRTRSGVNADGHDHYFLNLQLAGTCEAEQDGRRIRLQPGQMSLFDGARPYVLSFNDPFDQLVVHVPRATLADFGPLLERLSACPIDGSTLAGGLALKAAAALARAGDADHAVRLIADTALRFAVTDVSQRRGAHGRMPTSRETTRMRALALIRRSAADPALTPATLARRLNCSPRHLHAAFVGSGQTAGEAIWRERLDLAHKLLRNADFSGLTIDQIAAHCGFQTASHFVARFKARYGTTPALQRRRLQ